MTPNTRFKPGDVLRYVAETTHCRESTAFVTKDGRAVDTYWRTYGDGDPHRLTDDELATAEVRFNVSDYDALDPYSRASRCLNCQGVTPGPRPDLSCCPSPAAVRLLVEHPVKKGVG